MDREWLIKRLEALETTLDLINGLTVSGREAVVVAGVIGFLNSVRDTVTQALTNQKDDIDGEQEDTKGTNGPSS